MDASGGSNDAEAVHTVLGPRHLRGKVLSGALVGELLIHTTVPVSNDAVTAYASRGRSKTGPVAFADPGNLCVNHNDAAKELRSFRECTSKAEKGEGSGGECLVVELTTEAHGRDVEHLVELSSRNNIHVVCTTSPDDSKTAWHSSTATISAAVCDEVRSRMMADIQVRLATSSTQLTAQARAGAIGPIYLRFTSTSATQLHHLDVERIKSSAFVSSQFGGVPLLMFWDHGHPSSILEEVISTIRLHGGNSALSKTAFINAVSRIPWWESPPTKCNSTILHYDLTGVYSALSAGAFVGFTCSGSDSCFNVCDGDEAFWVGKSPFSSPSDFLCVLHHLTTTHPRRTFKWTCFADAQTNDSAETNDYGHSKSPKAAKLDASGTGQRTVLPVLSSPARSSDCRCIDEIRNRILISTGTAFKKDCVTYGGVGMTFAVNLAKILHSTGEAKQRGRVDFWDNATRFLSFVWKAPVAEIPRGTAYFTCHWCGKKVAEKSEIFEKKKFVYCCIGCVNAHRKQNFSASATETKCMSP